MALIREYALSFGSELPEGIEALARQEGPGADPEPRWMGGRGATGGASQRQGRLFGYRVLIRMPAVVIRSVQAGSR